MNHNVSAYIRNHGTMPTIKNRITRLLSVGIALYAVFGGMPCVDATGFLPNQMIVSTVPPNGDVNPYGVAFVPQGFQSGAGPLRAGDILVSNFNNSMNLQGTGTTIVRVTSRGAVSTFFAGPPHPGGSFYSAGGVAKRLCDCWKRAFKGWHRCNSYAGFAASD